MSFQRRGPSQNFLKLNIAEHKESIRNRVDFSGRPVVIESALRCAAAE
uniref:Uncharacterized protein n=1 Tax=Anguilla anguilla TaxID=7936 RepID=A0A0E9S115_ANGAN